MEAAIADAKKAVEEGGIERMNNAFNRLQTASHKLAEALYQQSASAGAGGAETQGASAGASTGSTSQGANDDNVIDAEYVDVDDKK